MKKIISIILLTAILILAVSVPTNAISGDFDTKINAVSYELPTEDFETVTDRDFRIMSDVYNINSVSIYGLEALSETNINYLFTVLKKYGLKLIVRIENYDAENFAFTESDAENVLSRYKSLLKILSKSENRELISYFAINMPVDDTNVQNNAGGLNSDAFNLAQTVYAKEIVKQLRSYLNRHNYNDAKLFLGVFYGWDNTYLTPAYTSANADGYFLTSYSYPVNYDAIPVITDSDSEIINMPRLKETADKFVSQYGNSPFAVEYGFHTLENSVEMPDQTAGIVNDRKTKKYAIELTKDFYAGNYNNCIGTNYFGFNIKKVEGNDNKVLDWMFVYPDEIEKAAAYIPKINNWDFSEQKNGWGFTGADENFKIISQNKIQLDFDSYAHDLFQSTAWFGYTTTKIDAPYTLSVFADTTNLKSGSVKFTVEFKKNNTTVLVYSSDSVQSGKAQKVTVNIPYGAYGVYDEIIYKAEITSGTGYILLSDFDFRKERSTIYNGSFENGSSASSESFGMWPDWNDQNFIDTNTAYSGRKSIKINLSSRQNYSVYSDIVTTDEAIKPYYCFIKVKYTDALDKMQLRVNRGENNSVYSEKFDLSGNSNGFLTYAFKTEFDKTADYLQIQVEFDTGSGTVWIDDFELIPSYELFGDINNDNELNIIDLVLLKKHIALCTSDKTILDIDKNGFITADDSIAVINALLK